MFYLKVSSLWNHYVRVNMNKKYRYVLAKLRFGILPLEIETGRWKNVDTGNISCQLCHTVEDE